MTTYNVRCRNSKCRHRRISKTHPLDYKVVPRCEVCGERKGWRLEWHADKRELCNCGGPVGGKSGYPFPHKSDHPFCEKHPMGIYNQARRAGAKHHEIPVEYGGVKMNEQSNQRRIDVSLTVQDGVAVDQVEYLCACILADQGVPIVPLTQDLMYGTITCEVHGQKRFYCWTGADRRI